MVVITPSNAVEEIEIRDVGYILHIQKVWLLYLSGSQKERKDPEQGVLQASRYCRSQPQEGSHTLQKFGPWNVPHRTFRVQEPGPGKTEKLWGCLSAAACAVERSLELSPCLFEKPSSRKAAHTAGARCWRSHTTTEACEEEHTKTKKKSPSALLNFSSALLTYIIPVSEGQTY